VGSCGRRRKGEEDGVVGERSCRRKKLEEKEVVEED
jgi:hypothetical protein